MAVRKKLSGSALAAQLSEMPFPAAAGLESPVRNSPDSASGSSLSPALPPAVARPNQVAARDERVVRNPLGGRPAKAGIDGIPVNVRVSQADHLALAKLAAQLMVPGRPLPTVQDVVRGLIRGALADEALALTLCGREGA